ncbi:MAG: hypothetical protein U0165_02470 [Polyangiaceae bacterium]
MKRAPRTCCSRILFRPAFDVARGDGGRAVIALHRQGGVSMTMLDGRAPSLTTAREYLDILLGGF